MRLLTLIGLLSLLLLLSHAAWGVTPATTYLVWPDVLVTVVNGHLVALSTDSDKVPWCYPPYGGTLNPKMIRMGDLFFISHSDYGIIGFDKKEIDRDVRMMAPLPVDAGVRYGLRTLAPYGTPELAYLDGPNVYGYFTTDHQKQDGFCAMFSGRFEETDHGMVEEWNWFGGETLHGGLWITDKYVLTDLGNIDLIDAARGGRRIARLVFHPHTHIPRTYTPEHKLIVTDNDRLAVSAPGWGGVNGYTIPSILNALAGEEITPLWDWRSNQNIQGMVGSGDAQFLYVSCSAGQVGSPENVEFTLPSPEAFVASLDMKTGTPRWRTVLQTGDAEGIYTQLQSLTLRNDRVLVLGQRRIADNILEYLPDPGMDRYQFHYYLYCLEASTGRKMWQHEIIGLEQLAEVTGSTAYLELQGYEELAPLRHEVRTAPAGAKFPWTQDELVPRLQAVDMTTGDPRWVIRDAHFLGESATLTYLQKTDGTVLAVETATGKTKYTYTVPKSEKVALPLRPPADQPGK